MMAKIKVHACSRGGFAAECKLPGGRNLFTAGETIEQAAHNTALRAIGAPTRAGRNGDEELLERHQIQLRHVGSYFDEEIFEMVAVNT